MPRRDGMKMIEMIKMIMKMIEMIKNDNENVMKCCGIVCTLL